MFQNTMFVGFWKTGTRTCSKIWNFQNLMFQPFKKISSPRLSMPSPQMRTAIYKFNYMIFHLFYFIIFMGWMLRFDRNLGSRATHPSCLSTLGGAIGRIQNESIHRDGNPLLGPELWKLNHVQWFHLCYVTLCKPIMLPMFILQVFLVVFQCSIMFNNVHKDRPGQGVQAEPGRGGRACRAGWGRWSRTGTSGRVGYRVFVCPLVQPLASTCPKTINWCADTVGDTWSQIIKPNSYHYFISIC